MRNFRSKYHGCIAAMVACSLHAPPAWAAVAVPPATADAVSYQHGLDLFLLFDFVFGLALAALFLATGWGVRLRDMAARLGRGRWFWTVSFTAIAYSVTTTLIGLPAAWCETLLLPHKYGLSTESNAHWLQDQAVSLGINAVTILALAWVPYLLLRRAPRSWYLWATAALLPFVVLSVAISPLLITPLFNHFGPLPDRRLEQVLRAEAGRVGLGTAPIYVMDQSTTSKAPGAYVTGLFGTREIVLYDTLVKTFNEKQIKFVLGHEMKHYLMDDVWKIVALAGLLLLGGFFAVHALGRWVLLRWGPRWGIPNLADPASVPLLMGVFSIAIFCLTPVLNLASQSIEHEADRFGLELTQDNDAAASAFVILQADNLGVPDPGFVQRVWRTNHPTLRDRIVFAETYHPWLEGKPLVYGRYMKAAVP